MGRHRSYETSAWKITRWDFWLGGAAFVGALAIGLSFILIENVRWEFTVPAALGVCLAASLYRRTLARHLRALGDRVGVSEPLRLLRPWIIDGDTIRDDLTGVCYRFANIDAPETGDNARCFHERRLGERAKSAAIRLVRAASRVEVRTTVRFDQYGRTVAYVLVDGADLGERLVKHGFARRWIGYRKRWCGPKGALVQMAAIRGEHHACAACAKWRS